MQEEYHGIKHEDATYTFKLLYGWNRLNVNIWLPSLSELVGTTGNEGSDGCYLSAMQGLNISSSAYWTDKKGGAQFQYFAQFNASGGKQKIWDACKRQQTWLRSPVQANGFAARAVVETGIIGDSLGTVTDSHAVHPVVGTSSISLASACDESSLIPLFLLSTKRHGKTHGSFVNALARA